MPQRNLKQRKPEESKNPKGHDRGQLRYKNLKKRERERNIHNMRRTPQMTHVNSPNVQGATIRHFGSKWRYGIPTAGIYPRKNEI